MGAKNKRSFGEKEEPADFVVPRAAFKQKGSDGQFAGRRFFKIQKVLHTPKLLQDTAIGHFG